MIPADADVVEYCRSVVADGDPDRYLASLFSPCRERPALWALLAFNQEIAKTRETVREPTIGLMRLQWWRDVVAQIYGGQAVVEGNPIVAALRVAVARYDLPRDAFDALINAREMDLEPIAPQGWEAIEDYADQTSTPLLSLMAKVVGALDVPPERLRYLGVAYALTGLVRAAGYTAQSDWRVIPTGVENVRAACELARDHLVRASELERAPVLRALVIMADLYLRQIERADYDVASPIFTRPVPFMALRVWGRMIG